MNRKKRGLLSRITACALAVSMAFAGSSCGSTKATETIFVIGQSQGIQFWDLLQTGAEDAGNELGYNIVYQNATDTQDVETQKQLIKRAISEKAKAIVFAPNDPSALNDDLKSAQTAGIKLVAIDAPCSLKGVSYIGTDNLSAGNIAGRNANSSILFGKGKVAIIKHSQTSSAASDRVNGFKQALKSSEGPDGIQFVVEESCNGNADTAKQMAIDAITANPDLKLIYTTNEKSTIGACAGVAEMELSGKVRVIGYNSNDAEISYLMDQTLTGTIIQSPYNMGYLGVKYASDLLDTVTINGVTASKTIPTNVDTGATYISLNNYSDDISQLLIHPDTFGKNQNVVAK
ncbi:MAG: substrate-binding domain-containing protein [Ruminococcus sp.]|nr:substrate-binding domain-containing protein [Ruminococcus sp.]